MVLKELRPGEQVRFQVQEFNPEFEEWRACSEMHPNSMFIRHLAKNFRILVPSKYRIIQIEMMVSVVEE